MAATEAAPPLSASSAPPPPPSAPPGAEMPNDEEPAPERASLPVPGSALANLTREVEEGPRPQRTPAVWLDAWFDPVAGVSAFSECVHTADLAGDGDWRLLVANADRKLKVWKGTSLASEHTLMDAPVAVCTFYSDHKQPRVPALAVATSQHLFIYRNLRPYYKFTLPNVDLDAAEASLWDSLGGGRVETEAACEQLAQLRDMGVHLTARSLDLLQMDQPGDRAAFVERVRGTPLAQQTVITCLAVLNKSAIEWDAVSCVVLGTESGHVYILDPSGTSVLVKKTLPSVPVFIAGAGILDVEYRLTIACRNGSLYAIKNGELTGVVIELDAQPVGLVRHPKAIVVGCMNNIIYNYHVKGKKNFSLHLPASIVCMENLSIERQRMVKATVVALANNEVRVYNDKHLVSLITMTDLVTGLRFGRFGREDNVLVCTTKHGALAVKILPRLANLEVSSQPVGPPPEQDIPLSVPKKTRLYVEQTQREREQATEMHRVFQRDLCKLRLQTARAYVKVLTDGQGPISYTAGSSLRLNAKVQGLGPSFKIQLNLQNTGTKPIYDVPVMLSASPIYAMSRTQLVLPVLVPGVTYIDEVGVRCVDQNGGADVVKVFVCSRSSAIPILSAIVKMPLVELLEGIDTQ
mmetsp:Transcript_11120/g.38624  ORF Transcript_11120/g.38624 Transcript_11120/m.38624 type:complete len:635 (+) Transcript_11120:151-2055(+)